MNAVKFLLPVVLLTGCAANVGEETDEANEKNLKVGSKLALSIERKTSGPVQVTVDCAPNANPDDVGPVFSANGKDFGVTPSNAPARAGYWSWAGNLSAGKHALTLSNVGWQNANCKTTVKDLSSQSCTNFQVWRSPNVNHTHLEVGDEAGDWEPLPASGNHWGAWAKWGVAYAKPVFKGFLLHNLEHGGLVLSYGCKSASESAACADAQKKLIGIANKFGQHRVVLTPDPTQKSMFAIRGWRWAYAGECLNENAALDFMARRFRHGREDIEADPPIPYDPTTKNVPCQNLMAAPDSCN
jgi:hypothetical protein